MATAKQIIDCATKYIGTIEKPKNNVIFNTRYYGKEVNGAQYPWCAVFLYEIFKECNASKLFCGGQKTALCQTVLNYHKNNGTFYKTNPHVGDLVFFKFGTTSRETNHIGIVTEVFADGVETIEGNTSDTSQNNGGMVMKKIRKGGIVGYGRPAYGDETPIPKPQKLKPIFENIYPQKGIDVAAWQKDLNYIALRQAGVTFAVLKIIRKDFNPDEMFETHYKGFKDAGIPIRCVYNYSYATTVDRAKAYAYRVISILNGRKIPVALDVEDKCLMGLGENLIQIINAYQHVIQAAGLKFCVYTGLNFYETYIKPYLGMLNNTQFWIARYPSNNAMSLKDLPNVAKKPNVGGLIAWQYSAKGRIPEAYNADLDFDILYSPIMTQMRKTGICITHSLRIRSTPDKTTKDNIVGYLKEGDMIVVYATDVKTGWYQIDLEGKEWVSNEYIKLN